MELYEYIENYALERNYKNTLRALILAEGWLSTVIRRTFKNDNKGTTSFEHCLEATKALMDLHPPVSADEEDILLASMLCHDMLENVEFEEGGEELVTEYRLDPRILEIVKLMTKPAHMTDEEKEVYYDKLKMNRLAVLVALADRANLVERITGVSISEANSYIAEMKRFVLPMCVYAKEYYRDFQMIINLSMEKIRGLIDVSEIISNRYEKREIAYANEILLLMEENARLRGMIRQLESGEIQ